MESFGTLVVGAGVVGLAVADALARAGHEVVIAESEALIGSGVSSRNSEVIHSGIYYPPGSAKARLCVRGKALLHAFCEAAGVPYRRCGKLIVAPRLEQRAALESLLTRGQANGVTGLSLLDRRATLAMEPELDVQAALWSETTGIVDSHALMTALLGRAETHGAALALKTRFVRAERQGKGFRVRLQDAQGEADYRVQRLVIASGLNAPVLARAVEGLPPERIPVQRYARGNYFALAGRAPFTRLVYPVPEKDGLGVHLTLDLAGQARFGPDVEWIDAPSYGVNPARLQAFYGEVRKYWPRLPDGALRPDYAGVRPKIYAPHDPAADFRLDGPAVHGVPNLVCLFGIESPGLTAALAIGESVAAMLEAASPIHTPPTAPCA
ncbi:MAG: NAD(P)/FAD-dependent oxidoreductase [Betaproteobacteria bacterium]